LRVEKDDMRFVNFTLSKENEKSLNKIFNSEANMNKSRQKITLKLNKDVLMQKLNNINYKILNQSKNKINQSSPNNKIKKVTSPLTNNISAIKNKYFDKNTPTMNKSTSTSTFYESNFQNKINNLKENNFPKFLSRNDKVYDINNESKKLFQSKSCSKVNTNNIVPKESIYNIINRNSLKKKNVKFTKDKGNKKNNFTFAKFQNAKIIEEMNKQIFTSNLKNKIK